MPINPTTLKALIDTQITNETVDFAITPAEVGGRMKDIVDYTSEQIDLAEVLTNKSTNVTADGSSDTKYPSVKAVKDYVDANSGGDINYKILSFWMTISSGVLTVEEIENQFESTTFTYEIPTNGRVQVQASSPVFTSNKTSLERGAFGTASGGFFCRYVAATTSIGLIYFTRWDNDTTVNPSVSRLRIEIRVYE
jgi:hypothetical protein